MKKNVNFPIDETLRSKFKILAETMSMNGNKTTSQELMESALELGYDILKDENL